MRIGQGIDVHSLSKKETLILGGVDIPAEMGLVGHSDADVLLHAIMDALFGAVSLGDIGEHFPDTSSDYKNIDSQKLLDHCYREIKTQGYRIVNIDSVIMAERPKLAPYIDDITSNVARVLEISTGQVSVKATTLEGLGFVGRREGIMAQAVVLLEKNTL